MNPSGIIKPILTNTSNRPYKLFGNKHIKLHNVIYNQGKLSYIKDADISLYANYSGVWSEVGNEVSNFKGEADIYLHPSGIPEGINSVLFYTVSNINGIEYKSNVTRANFI